MLIKIVLIFTIFLNFAYADEKKAICLEILDFKDGDTYESNPSFRACMIERIDIDMLIICHENSIDVKENKSQFNEDFFVKCLQSNGGVLKLRE